MAIAPSKLGRLVAEYWSTQQDDDLIRRLREAALVRTDATDAELRATFAQAREEHEQMDAGNRPFNSPNERVRVFLAPYLTAKGTKWAVPLESMTLPDDEPSPGRPWWKFWA